MVNKIKLSKQFVDDFNMVMKYYNVAGDELELEKQRVRDNPEDAIACYTDISKKLSILVDKSK